jgi:peptide/nickel transport system permease protein
MLRDMGRELRRPGLTIPVFILVCLVFVAVFAPQISPHDPLSQDLRNRLEPPAWAGGDADHILGTDSLGRDCLSRLLYGARITLVVALTAILAGGAVGLAVGLVSAYIGGRVDAVLMRTADVCLSFPIVLFGLLLAVLIGASMWSVVLAVTLVYWARFARVVRGEVLSLRERDFIAQAKINGCSPLQIMVRYVVPNILHTFMVMLSLNIGLVILAEASLSFLGAGVPPPTPSWGQMISEGRDYIRTAWWLSFTPGLCIVAVVLSFNLLGDWLRDVMDPKLRQV